MILDRFFLTILSKYALLVIILYLKTYFLYSTFINLDSYICLFVAYLVSAFPTKTLGSGEQVWCLSFFYLQYPVYCLAYRRCSINSFFELMTAYFSHGMFVNILPGKWVYGEISLGSLKWKLNRVLYCRTFLSFNLVIYYTERRRHESVHGTVACSFSPAHFTWNNFFFFFSFSFFFLLKKSSPEETFSLLFREREISIGCLLYVPGLGIEPTTLQLWDDTPTNWATLARAGTSFLRIISLGTSVLRYIICWIPV